MAFYPSFCIVILALGIYKTSSVSIRTENNQLEPIKPSPVDKSQSLPDEKTPEKFASLTEDITVENSHSKRDNSDKKNEEIIINEDKTNKRTRTTSGAHGRLTERDKLNCCGNRFESSPRPESLQMPTRTPDSNRYGDRYGNRPDDPRFNWHSSSGRPGGSSSASNDRYGTRPSFYNGPDVEHTRPGSANSRPVAVGGRPGYGYGYGGGYAGDNGAYGSHGFEVSHRPGSINFSGGNRPQGGYGIHGTVGQQEEGGEAEGAGPPMTNIHTQKAVALKALAGVALIGAAAALAANPALIPVGAVLAGRKRRSTPDTLEFNLLQFPEQFIRQHVPKIYEDDQVAKKFWDSRKCVARLTCEVQKEYIAAVRSNPSLQKDVQRQLVDLIKNNILSAHYVRETMKTLTKIARNAKSQDGRCDIFTCDVFIP